MESGPSNCSTENTVDAMQIKENSLLKPVQSTCIDTLKEEIEAQLKEGKFDEAVESYGILMEKLIESLEGDGMNPSLAENYARYGSLLLRLAIRNNDQNVLSSKSGVAGSSEQATEALLEVSSLNKKKLIELDENEDEEDAFDEKEADEKCAEEAQDEKAAAISDVEIPGLGAEDDEFQDPADFDAAPEEEADEDDFTIAFENLDVARILFEKRIDATAGVEAKKRLQKSLGHVLQDLGDLALEDENFSQAISEYERALEVFGTPEPEILRDLAGIYFNFALSLEFENDLPRAKEMYTMSKELLQQKEFCERDSSVVSELRALIEEISAKVEDMDANSTNNQAALSAQLQEATNQAAFTAAQSLNGSVNDLSGMIKKRKAEKPEAAQEAKDTKTE